MACSRSAFSATYSNGQARPITAIAPATRPVTRPVASPSPQPALTVPSNSGSLQDGVIFSLETRGLGNASSSLERASIVDSSSRRAARGNAKGPLYSDEFRNALDSLLG